MIEAVGIEIFQYYDYVLSSQLRKQGNTICAILEEMSAIYVTVSSHFMK